MSIFMSFRRLPPTLSSTHTARKAIYSFSKCSKKMIFPKKWRWNMIFLVLLGKMIFLFPENIISFFRQKMKDDLSQKTTWNYDIFFKCSQKMIFPKQSHWNMIFLVVVSGKMIFFFPENIILFFRWKMKDDLSQKIHGNTIFLSNAPKTLSFEKNRAGIWSFLYIWKDGFFFPENVIFFLSTENERWSFSRNTWRYDIFCIYVQMLQIWYYPSAKKNQRWSSPEKIHLQLTYILDPILERVPTIFCTFMETFIGVFICCFPVKKNQET